MTRFAPIVATLVLAACSSSGTGTGAPSATGATASSAAPSAPPSASVDAELANGASIFRTGRDSAGARIVAKPPALFPTCAACHRADGSGGVHLPGGAVSADLRHKALVTNQKPPYTLALVERAVSAGIDNTGQRLSPVMPRWKLSQRDLHDVARYVLTGLR